MKIIKPAVVVLGTALLALYLTCRASAQENTKALDGKPAPDVVLKTLDGKTVKLSDQKGSVVLLDFWATWCPPCRKSLPHVQELSANKPLAEKGLKVWAVNARETQDRVESFLRSNKYTFTVPMDAQGKVMASYLVHGIPTTVIVGRDGVVKSVFIGYDEDSAKLIDQAVAKALDQSEK